MRSYMISPSCSSLVASYRLSASLGRRDDFSPSRRLLTRRPGRSTLTKPSALYPDMSTITLSDIEAAVTATTPGLLTGAALNSTVFIVGMNVLLKGLTPLGVAHAWFLGTLAFSAFGLGGYFLVCLYFVLGTAVTKVKMAQKQAEGIAEKRSGRRGPGSVWGSGAAGAIAAVAALLLGDPSGLLRIAFVASFASKLSDTASSEIGKAYGKNTFLVTTFATVPRGTEGAVSVEGTAAGVVAAVIFSLVALQVHQLQSPTAAAAVALAAVMANYLESLLGATVQGKVAWLTNDVINAIQISLGAGIAVGLAVATGAL